MDTPNGTEAQTALVKRVDAEIVARVEKGLPPDPTADIETFVHQVASLKSRVNLLAPITSPAQIKPLHQIGWAVVHVNPDPQGSEVYFSKTFHKKDEVSLSKIAIYNLIHAAGGYVLPVVREDDRGDPRFCRMNATVVLYTMDGHRPFSGSRELDLRDGSLQIKHLTPGQLAGQRARISELCETFAIERAVRGILSLQGSYTKDELRKPFFVLKYLRHLDMNDPDQKALALKEHEQASQNLFGPFPSVPPQLPQEAATPQPTPEPEKQAPAPTPPPAPPKEPEEKLPSIAVQEKIGELAGKIAKERGGDCGLGDVIQEFSSAKNKAGKTVFCRNPFDKRFEKSQVWARYTLKRLQEEFEDDTAWLGDVGDDEVPE